MLAYARLTAAHTLSGLPMGTLLSAPKPLAALQRLSVPVPL